MYCAAKKFIAEQCPGRLADFEAAFQPLRTRPDFEVLKLQRFLNAKILREVKEQTESLNPEMLDKHEFFKFGREILQDYPAISGMQRDMTEQVSVLVNEELEPGYSFVSLYNNLGVCELHMDSPFSKWTLDICIEQTGEWPIHISNVVAWPEHLVTSPEFSRDIVLNDSGTIFRSYTHQPGDALLFAGSSQWHYRDRIPVRGKKNFAHLLFFHYFPKGMLELTQPERWPELFDLPELAEHVSPCVGTIMTDFSTYKSLVSKKYT